MLKDQKENQCGGANKQGKKRRKIGQGDGKGLQ